jgi:hypothetical protein
MCHNGLKSVRLSSMRLLAFWNVERIAEKYRLCVVLRHQNGDSLTISTM